MPREMKDSGIEWIGEIPTTWELKRLKALFEERKEKNDPIQTDFILSLGAAYGVIPYAEKEGGGNKAKEDLSDYRIAYPNDIVMNSMNIISGSVGISKYYGCVSPVYYMLYPRFAEKVDANYYCYMFQTKAFQRSLLGLGNGILIKESANGNFNTVRMRIPMEKLGVQLLPTPTLTEQKAIADFLDRRCAEIDAVIEQTKATIEEYKKLKQSVITEAVTKGIRGDRPMKDSGIEWIGEIPSEWEVIPHKYVMHKEKTIREHYSGEDIISLTMNGVIVRDLTAGGKMPTTFDGYQYVEEDDLLLCLFDIDVTPRCVGVVRNNGITSPAYSRFKVHKGFYNCYYDYLLRFIDDEKVFVHLAKNLRSSLTETDFGAIKTVMPSFVEQKEIADYLDQKCAEIDTLIEKKTALLAEMETYKKSLIFEYVTGKKEVV